MIRRLLYKLNKWVWDYGHDQAVEAGRRSAEASISALSANRALIGSVTPKELRLGNEIDIDGLRLTLMKAEGGVVVQTRTVDSKTHESTLRTYVIAQEDDLANRIAQILTLELLRS
jgi:hypothetical protein